MTNESLKIVVPMAGLGTRLRPHTWSKPKQLVSVADKAVLGHVLDMFSTLPDPENVELVFIVGYLGEHMRPYMERHYPHMKVHYVVQEEPRGQSHAIYVAREHLSGPMLMVFADTLIETDLSFLEGVEEEALSWVKPVSDPRRFGVVELDESDRVVRLIEKPDSMENDLAVVGFYYFQSSEDLLAAIEEQMRQDIQLKGEFFLADAINLMLDDGLRMGVRRVDVWLDAGTPDALLETNAYLLENSRDNSEAAARRGGVVVIPPVYVHPDAQVADSVIGPNASIGSGCQVNRSLIENAIVEEGAVVDTAVLSGSLIGQNARVKGRASIINAGDDADLQI